MNPGSTERAKTFISYAEPKLGQRQIARSAKLSQSTVHDYLARFQQTGSPGRADLVSPIIEQPVVLADPNDDPVVYTAIAGRADVLCAVDRDFYAADVVSFCRERG